MTAHGTWVSTILCANHAPHPHTHRPDQFVFIVVLTLGGVLQPTVTGTNISVTILLQQPLLTRNSMFCQPPRMEKRLKPRKTRTTLVANQPREGGPLAPFPAPQLLAHTSWSWRVAAVSLAERALEITGGDFAVIM